VYVIEMVEMAPLGLAGQMGGLRPTSGEGKYDGTRVGRGKKMFQVVRKM
jgi:hypothetical protein